jgi:hypothetical protein
VDFVTPISALIIMKRFELNALLITNSAAIGWARDNGLLATQAKCPTCSNDMKLVEHHSTDGQIWACKKTVDGTRHQKKTCIREGSIFLGTRLGIREAILLIYEWSWETPVTSLVHEYDTNRKCVSEWFSKLREVAGKDIIGRLQFPLGGATDVVEIDEAQIGRRKAHKGRKRKEIWVFGAVVRGTRHRSSFMKIVKNRKKNTLQPAVEENISKNIKLLVSDSWVSYEDLGTIGYNHKIVNHSKNYVSPDDDTVHTQTIEGYWKHLREFLNRKGGYKRMHLSSFLNEFIFRRNALDCFECILSAIQRGYSV